MENNFPPEEQKDIRLAKFLEAQKAIKNAKSPEAQEAIKRAKSPKAQKAIKRAKSPATQNAMKHANSPDICSIITLTDSYSPKRQKVNRTHAYYSRLQKAQELLDSAFGDKPRPSHNSDTYRIMSQSALESLRNALTLAELYLPPEEKEQYETIIKPKLEEKSSSRLTLSDILSLLSLLVTIFFGIISSMSDEQAERIIAQNEVIIEQNNEIIQLKKEDEALLDALDSLSDSINLLTDEVKSLREELESSNDPSDGSGQPDTENTQQQDCDAQN